MIVDGFRSQLNNIITFRGMFSPRHVLNYLYRIPVTVNLLITSQCNLRCQICSIKDGLGDADELTTEQIKTFIRSLRREKPDIFRFFSTSSKIRATPQDIFPAFFNSFYA